MRVLFDTSVLVASAILVHPSHAICERWLQAAIGGRVELVISTHTLAEFYRVLTSIKASPQFTAAQVWRLLTDNILQIAEIVELRATDYQDCLQRLVATNQRGGIVYDALIVQSALKARVDRLLTLNEKHFQRVWPNHTDQVINPLTTQVP